MTGLVLVLTLLGSSMTTQAREPVRPVVQRGSTVPETPPNVVFVLTDDQRMRTLHRMPKVTSELVQKGVEFTNVGTPTSLCCPSRVSFLTGLFGHTTRVFSNGAPYGGWDLFRTSGLEQATVATALDDAGYHTAFVGKYLNGFAKAAAQGYVPPGWDEFVTFTTSPSHYNYTLNDGRQYGEQPEDYATDVLAGHAVDIVRSAPENQPLFLHVATTSPHRPFVPAPRHIGTWAGRIPSYNPKAVRENVADKPRWVRRHERLPQERIDADIVGMAEMLMSVDDAVGDLVQALEETGRMEDTLFVFASDNGLMLGEHHLLEWKNLPYWWSTMIPVVVRWDGHLAAGSKDDRLALNLDVTTTIINAAGATMATEGLDLLGTSLRSGYPLEATKTFKFDSPPTHPAYCGYRTRRWMFVQYNNGFREMYDYRHDPQELHNRAYTPSYREKMVALRKLARATCRPRPPEFSWS